MSEAYNARLQEIKSRQQNWFLQRESAIEREKVEADLLASRGATTSSATSSRVAGADASDVERTVQRVAPEELVDALTIRLAEKIKAELQLEDRAELGKVQAQVRKEKASVNKLEGYLAKEIASHKCPICYELMIPPDNSPMLLFPCGHTFCKTCLRTHEKYNRRKCPYCRQKIESTAANMSLQQLTQNYVQQKRRLKAKTGSDARAGGDEEGEEEGRLFEDVLGEGGSAGLDMSTDSEGGDATDQDALEDTYDTYVSKYRSVEMRVRILENELLDTKDEQMKFDEDLEAGNKVLEHLLREKQNILREEEKIQKMKQMIQEQLQVQELKLKQVTQRQEHCAQRSSLIVETLKPLTGELDKLRLIMEGIETRRQQ
ncbi:RING-type domain-containing protein [Chloropicon primus]|uniref:RING-type domain-containing protein n=2 Tax=Chloropicon primus TaxID=1764295 RepID=A0A5B8MQN9_9CHLO|nr:hypothetical protein A3770_06p41400 [Chloropicon primus]UPR00833.1 RING-type domain-containing protein [Chloropicon primus]|eukprot:QDZ21622.1 hypothetical protein A3770_06p41400 [Chloropicon primus]